MNTLSMAFKNLKNNFSFYALYLVSVSFVITIFFAFTSFSMNNVMLEKISSDGRVESMCRVISVCLMAFVIFYMTYSNRFFLKRRSKELGIYALLGYRIFTILVLLTLENLLIFFGSLLLGLLFGALLHKGIVLGITALLGLSIDNKLIPFFHFPAILKTISFIALVVLMMLLSNARLLLSLSLMDLVRFEKKAEKGIKLHRLLALTGAVLTLLGYALALDILKGSSSIWIQWGFYQTGMITFFLVVCGSVLFISSFLPFAVQQSKKNKKGFYTETRMITTPNFIYRIRSNAKTLIMLTLLSAATLTVAGVMALTLYYPILAVSRMAPSELEMRIDDESQVEAIKELINNHVSEKDVSEKEISYTETDIVRVTSSAQNLPVEYSLGTAKGDSQNERLLRTPGFECISCSQYEQLLNQQGKESILKKLLPLSDNECILVKYQPGSCGTDEAGSVYPLSIDNTTTSVIVKETTLHNPFAFANSIGTLVVSDNLYEQMRTALSPAVRILSINGKCLENNEELYWEIDALLNNSPYLQGNSHRIHIIFSLNSSTFLLIGFLLILFFIATGSILYFNNITFVSDTKSDYDILTRMGYSDKTIRRIIRKQILTFFLIPFIFGLIDCIFATLVYKTGLMQNLLGNSLALYAPAITATGLSAAIYLIYYLLTVRACRRIIFKD